MAKVDPYKKLDLEAIRLERKAQAKPVPRSKQSLIEEAAHNAVAAEEAAARGDDEAVQQFRENERICLIAARKAKA